METKIGQCPPLSPSHIEWTLEFPHLFFFFFNEFTYLFIIFWLRWVFAAARGLSLAAASRSVVVRRPLIEVASPVAEHGL